MRSAEYRYARGGIRDDVLRGGFGLACMVAPLALADPIPALAWIFSAGAALFAAFLGVALIRRFSVVHVDSVGIAIAGPTPRRIAWDELKSLTLRCYATRRRAMRGFRRGFRDGGESEWMQLSLRAGGFPARPLSIDSGLDGFSRLVGRVAAEARRRGIELSPGTIINLQALGAEPPLDDENLAGSGA